MKFLRDVGLLGKPEKKGISRGKKVRGKKAFDLETSRSIKFTR